MSCLRNNSNSKLNKQSEMGLSFSIAIPCGVLFCCWLIILHQSIGLVFVYLFGFAAISFVVVSFCLCANRKPEFRISSLVFLRHGWSLCHTAYFWYDKTVYARHDRSILGWLTTTLMLLWIKLKMEFGEGKILENTATTNEREQQRDDSKQSERSENRTKFQNVRKNYK